MLLAVVFVQRVGTHKMVLLWLADVVVCPFGYRRKFRGVVRYEVHRHLSGQPVPYGHLGGSRRVGYRLMSWVRWTVRGEGKVCYEKPVFCCC